MIVRRTIGSLLVLTLSGAVSADAIRQIPTAPASQNEIIERRVLPHLEYLFQTLIAESATPRSMGPKRSAEEIDFCQGGSRLVSALF
jgi:hypothetical protein